MKDNLRCYLERLHQERPELNYALLTPSSQANDTWLLEWSTVDDGLPMPFSPETVPLSLDPLPFERQSMAMGVVLESQWESLGLMVWTSSVSIPRSELQQALEAGRRLYWELVEHRWSDTVTALLDALHQQRNEIGSAIHRGPAQAMTAARLELAFLGTSALAVSKAVERASDELVALVHGKLRGRATQGGLLEALRAELRFQARWRGLESEGTSVVLPSENLARTLADLWLAVGGKVRRSGSVIGFDEGAAAP